MSSFQRLAKCPQQFWRGPGVVRPTRLLAAAAILAVPLAAGPASAQDPLAPMMQRTLNALRSAEERDPLAPMMQRTLSVLRAESGRAPFVRPIYYFYGHAGAVISGDRDLNQTAGGYDGQISGGSGPAIGATAEATVYRFGMPTMRSFGTFDVQVRVTVDYMETRNLGVSRTLVLDDGRRLNNSQANFLAGLQVRTPIKSGRNSYYDLYVAALGGVSRVSASGSPLSGVNLQGSDTTWAVRLLAGLDIGLGGPLRGGIEYSYQRTGTTEFTTNFANEFFRQQDYGTSRIVARVGVALGGDFQPYYRSLTTNDRTIFGQASDPHRF